MPWDEDKKAKVIKMYTDSEPTPESSVEIVKSIAEEVGETANGVRMILSQAEVYVKKVATSSAASGDKKAGSTRVNKAEAIQALKDIIAATGNEAEDDILDKLTGKQAVYFTAIFKSLDTTDSE